MKLRIFAFFWCIALPGIISADEQKSCEHKSCEPKSILEMPAPLFCLGQNIINKHEIFAGTTSCATFWHRDELTTFMPSLLYGVTDTLCLTLFVPTIIDHKNGGLYGDGLGDIVPGFEWAYLNKKDGGTSITQATVLAQIKIPVSDNRPILTTGNVDITLGTTLIHTNESAYMFASTGILIPTWKNNFRKGYQFFYEAGIGPIIHKTDESLLSIFLECSGIYTTTDVNNPFPSDLMLKNNVIYAGPVLYWGYKNMLLQVGVQAPLTQSYDQLVDKRSVRTGMEAYFIF